MAIVSSNNLGRIRKKSGPNTFRKWRTETVMAVYTSNVRNPNTEAQQLVRTRFKAISVLARGFKAAYKVGFKAVTDGTKTPPRAYFIKQNWSHVHADVPGSSTIDYESLVISNGSLPQVNTGAVTATNPLEVNIALNDSGTDVGANEADKCFAVVYNPTTKSAVMSQEVLRVEEDIKVNVPSSWNGNRVHVYLFAVGGGDNNMGETSNSQYLGSVSIS